MMANTTLEVSTNLSPIESIALLFYLTDPSKTSFPTIESCPDYVNQVRLLIETILIAVIFR